jgi:alpha-L-arabinofuranosidase
LRAALGEAAFMTGMERNSDIVELASYAPLFVNMNHRAWSPDLINFDSSRWYGIPSYYVQMMFAENRGDMTLPVQVVSPMADSAADNGKIGVGTWNTQAEFKDAKVTAPDGTVLFASNFSGGTKGWEMLGDGKWDVDDGALRQNADGTFIRALAGDRNWTNYTYSVKARKLGGREGFLVLFRINGKEDRNWWNIGGWENTQNAVEIGATIDPHPAHIDTGRWYDIRIEVSDKHVKCYLDGQLIHDVNYNGAGQVTSLYASAAKDAKTGDIILKVVNANAKQLETALDLTGAKNLTGKGSAIVLTSDDLANENSLDEPMKVSPKTEAVSFSGTGLSRAFPANSFTVLRLQTRN